MATLSPPPAGPSVSRDVARMVDAVKRALAKGDRATALSLTCVMLERTARLLAGDVRSGASSVIAELNAAVFLLEKGAADRALEALLRARATSRSL
jgi:hypothetical protein